MNKNLLTMVAVTLCLFAGACSPSEDRVADQLRRDQLRREQKPSESQNTAADAQPELDSSASVKPEAEPSMKPEAGQAEEEPVDFRPRSAIPEFPEFKWETTRVWNLPLNNPGVVSATEAYFMEPDDYVLGVLVGRNSRAYPWFVLANYHAINDYIGTKPVIITLCDACNGGAAFLANTDQTLLDFRPMGVKNGTWYAIDFQTGSYWYPFAGKAFAGPLKGTKLKRLRAYFCTWREWANAHPETTLVVSSDEVRNREHGQTGHMANTETFNPELMARLAVGPPNPKLKLLPGATLVYGLIPPDDDSSPQAYSLPGLQRRGVPFLQTTIGNVPIVLTVQGEYQVGAYVRQVRGEDVELKLVSESPLTLEDQFGNQWDAWGRKVDGPDYQFELPTADGYFTKWYEWLENYPDTELFANP